jgi:Mg2+-importing ATPase
MMSVLVENPEGKAILLTKGSPEEVFHQCSHFELNGKLSPMDPELMCGLREEYESLSILVPRTRPQDMIEPLPCCHRPF